LKGNSNGNGNIGNNNGNVVVFIIDELEIDVGSKEEVLTDSSVHGITSVE
jgi:hypothetical protein